MTGLPHADKLLSDASASALHARGLVRSAEHKAAIAEIESVAHLLDAAIVEIVGSWRAYGASWQDVGLALSLTRQAAFARYSERLK